MTALIVLFLLVGGGFLAYRYLKALEAEIRAEIESPEKPESAGEDKSVSYTSPGTEQETASELPERILQSIKTRPGILQKDFYSLLGDVDKKILQQELQDLDRAGRIIRNRSGNTYRLTLNNQKPS